MMINVFPPFYHNAEWIAVRAQLTCLVYIMKLKGAQRWRVHITYVPFHVAPTDHRTSRLLLLLLWRIRTVCRDPGFFGYTFVSSNFLYETKFWWWSPLSDPVKVRKRICLEPHTCIKQTIQFRHTMRKHLGPSTSPHTPSCQDQPSWHWYNSHMSASSSPSSTSSSSQSYGNISPTNQLCKRGS